MVLPDEEKKNLRYHRKCRLSVMKLKLKRPASGPSNTKTSAKRGRPAKNEETTRKSLRSPEGAPKPKEKKCVFAPSFCQWNDKDILHNRYAVTEEDLK